jgi:hypothetical protein
MWKTLLNKSVQEVRFVLKQAPEHHGVWSFVNTRLPELRMLNQNTFFTITEIDDAMKTDSACHVVFGDAGDREDSIETAGLSAAAFEQILKSKVEEGLKLERQVHVDNKSRALPVSVVEAHKYVKYMDDGF